MALTAVVTLNPSSTVSREKPITALVTVSNSGASPIQITEIVPKFKIVGASIDEDLEDTAVAPVQLSPNPYVPAGGSTNYTFVVSFHSPSNQFAAYSVGALVYGNDGQLIAATPASITVTNP